MRNAVLLSVCYLLLSEYSLLSNSEKIDEIYRNTNITNNTYWAPLDHFTPTDPRQVQFIYESNPEFYQSGNPIFIYINDGAGIRWITSGLVYDLARELRAGLVTTHNRFFGLNTFINTTIENLKYLTFDNMLADVPHFLTQVREDYEAPDAPIIIWGTRMGATTAALARKKFPHLISGAWSSSGLFRAYLPETTYYSSVSDHFYNHGSPECASNLSHILNEIRELVEATNSNRLTELFRLCDPINFDDPQSITFFYVNVFRFIATHLERMHYIAIQQICRDITVDPDPLLAFIRWVDYEFYTDGCRNINYDRWILQRHDLDARNMGRSTTWYYCTQNAFDFYVTSPESGMFPDVVNQTYYNRLCEDTFSLPDLPYSWTALQFALNNFNVQHGAQNQVITNTIFSHGNLDPMLAHGIYEHLNFVSEIVSTGLYGMEADLESISETDSLSLRSAKETIVSALRRFALGSEETVIQNNELR